MPGWEIVFEPRINTRSPELLELLVELEAYRKSVMKIPLPPSMRPRFDRLNIIRQIKGTTGIEGNTLSEARISAVLEAEDAKDQSVAPSREEKEVLNANQVLSFIRDEVKRENAETITEKLIKTLHQLSTNGCEYDNNRPGYYRQHQVTVGQYEPPDHREIPELMRRFLSLINSRQTIEGFKAPIRAILAHFYLISIHPFGDGNGRTSRALEAYLLYQAGYNVRGFYSLANYLYRHRDEYIEKLQETRFRNNGDVTEFITFCLRGFNEELELIQDEILGFVRSILFQDMILHDYNSRVINTRCFTILEYLRNAEVKELPEEALKTKQHFLAKSLYEGLSVKTVIRDLRTLQSEGYILIRDGTITLNLAIMDAFA